jgi:HK97 family phage prohead protease
MTKALDNRENGTVKKDNKTCLQCGACCKVLHFPTSKAWEAVASEDFLKIRGVKKEDGVLKIKSVCQHLTAAGKCGINATKPKSCSDMVPGSIRECPLYEGGKEMAELDAKEIKYISFDHKSAADLSALRKTGIIFGFKTLPLENIKAGTDDAGNVYVEGYANTKGHPDRYGDIPTVFGAIRSYIYDLTNFSKNPVGLLNHWNQAENIAGSFNPVLGGACEEDEKGLRVRFVFSNSDYPPVAHVRTLAQEGHWRAFSIGGKWSYEDKDNPMHLTHAEIYEISLVGVGADPDAVTYGEKNGDAAGTKGQARNLKEAISLISESIKAGRVSDQRDVAALTALKSEIETSEIKEEEPSWLTRQ